MFGLGKRQSDAEYEAALPVSVENDPRLGQPATDQDGCTGIIESVHRFGDGTEYFGIYNPETGKGHGGLEAGQVKIS